MDGLNRIHDGCHIIDYKNYFEWWYFDFDLSDGSHLYFEWQAPVFNIRDDNCMLIVRRYRGNGPIDDPSKFTMSIKLYKRHTVTMDDSRCDIDFRTGHIKEQNDGYLIVIDEKEIKADIKIKRMMPPLCSYSEKIIESGTGEYFAWNIPQPKALAEGTLTLNGETLTVDGQVYHDHNWGNLNIGKSLKGWIWARVYFEKYMLILGDLQKRFSDESVQHLLFVDEHGNKHGIESFDITYEASDSRTNGRLKVPENIRIDFIAGSHYRILSKINNDVFVQVAPLSTFASNHLNTLYSKLFYFFKLYFLPEFLMKFFRRLYYYQGIAEFVLYKDHELIDAKNGKLEVFSFDK